MPSTPFELSCELFVVVYVLFDAFDLGLLFAYILSVSTVWHVPSSVIMSIDGNSLSLT